MPFRVQDILAGVQPLRFFYSAQDGRLNELLIGDLSNSISRQFPGFTTFSRRRVSH